MEQLLCFALYTLIVNAFLSTCFHCFVFASCGMSQLLSVGIDSMPQMLLMELNLYLALNIP